MEVAADQPSDRELEGREPDDPGASDPSRRGRRPSPAMLTLVALSVTAVVLAVIGGYLGGRLNDIESAHDRHDRILSAARQETLNFTTYDYEEFDKSVERVLSGATGTLKEEYRDRAEKLKELVVEYEAASEGEVLEAGVVSSDEDSASVLLVVDSVVRNTGVPDGDRRHYRMRMDLVREGDRWLASNIQYVP